MRIALDTQSTLGRKTGIGIYTSELLAAMRRVAPEHEYVELNWENDVSMRLDKTDVMVNSVCRPPYR